MVCPRKPGALLLILSILFHIIDSYPNNEMARAKQKKEECHECRLQKNMHFSKESAPIFQCIGCCFSRAYPTSLQTKNAMMEIKNITSEATCCIAREVTTLVMDNFTLRNHTDCECSTCY